VLQPPVDFSPKTAVPEHRFREVDDKDDEATAWMDGGRLARQHKASLGAVASEETLVVGGQADPCAGEWVPQESGRRAAGCHDEPALRRGPVQVVLHLIHPPAQHLLAGDAVEQERGVIAV